MALIPSCAALVPSLTPFNEMVFLEEFLRVLSQLLLQQSVAGLLPTIRPSQRLGLE